MHKRLIAGLTSILLSSASNAGVIAGTFSGSIYSAYGSLSGLELSTVIGATITGNVIYDSDWLPLVSGGTAPSVSTFLALQNTSSPLVIASTFGGATYTISGTSFSEVDVIPASPGNLDQVVFRSQNVFTNPVPTGDTLGNFTFHLISSAGQSFLSDLSDSGSMAFNYHNSGNINLALGSGAFTNSEGVGIGGINFSITDAAFGPALAIPEPSTYALFLACLGATILVSRRRKTLNTCNTSATQQ
ncbi:MAG: PEP-CTERM sorting domain-containing protein [Burkholderiales bacterium]